MLTLEDIDLSVRYNTCIETGKVSYNVTATYSNLTYKTEGPVVACETMGHVLDEVLRKFNTKLGFYKAKVKYHEAKNLNLKRLPWE